MLVFLQKLVMRVKPNKYVTMPTEKTTWYRSDLEGVYFCKLWKLGNMVTP